MIKQILVTMIGVFSLSSIGWTQQGDPVLFSVSGTPVQVSEFTYIYSKTNGDNADYSKESLKEYLELYKNFKLKVQRARDMKLDTISALQTELDGYRQQLANSYLMDREVTDKLVKEAYDRSLTDVNISHILFRTPKGATPKDTLTAYEKAIAVNQKLTAGGIFEMLAKEHSEDPSVKDNAGDIGYLTALFPSGFYTLESAVYNLKKGEMAGPVRSPMGYHIVRLNDVREARGEIEVAHILVRKKDPNAETIIKELHASLQKGTSFEELAKSKSQDKITAPKGGYIGFFGINKFERSFENAAFALSANNEISKPIQTKAGWHIIKLISKKPMEDYDNIKNRLKVRIQKDPRFELAKKAMIARIKKDNNYLATTGSLNEMGRNLNDDFLTYKWKPAVGNKNEILFGLGQKKYSMKDFMEYLENNSRKRLDLAKRRGPSGALLVLFNDFVSESCLKYEEAQLEKKYPDFKSLMREYEEGILLFEATKQLVWDKASSDSTGLMNFHNKNKDKYKWNKRAVGQLFSVKDSAKDKVDAIREFAKNNPTDKILETFNISDKLVSVEERVFEAGKNEELDKINWEVGAISENQTNKRSATITFFKIEKLLPSTIKDINEARGYVVSDYQDYLEKEWIEELQKVYKVKVNKKALEKLIKK